MKMLSWHKVLPVTLLVLSGCAKTEPGPVKQPRPSRGAATPRPTTPRSTLKALLADLAHHKGKAVAIRKVLSRHLPPGQAAAMAEEGSATVLRISGHGESALGAFLELRPAPPRRCDPKSDEAAKVYWLAERVRAGGARTLTATPVKTQMFWGQKPKPEVELPTEPLQVPVFMVKADLTGDNRCPQDQRYFSLEVTEVYTVAGGRLRRILKVHSQEMPQVAGATLDNSVKTRWVETEDKKTLYLGVVRVDKQEIPEHAAPRPGVRNDLMYRCTRKVTVYEITAAGNAIKLSSATLKVRRKNTLVRVMLPEDLTSKRKGACDWKG